MGSVEEVKCQSRLHRPPITFLRRKKKRTDAKGNKKKDDRRNKKRVCSLISYPSTIAFASCFPLEYPNSPAQQTSYNKLNATRVARCGERCKKTWYTIFGDPQVRESGPPIFDTKFSSNRVSFYQNLNVFFSILETQVPGNTNSTSPSNTNILHFPLLFWVKIFFTIQLVY